MSGHGWPRIVAAACAVFCLAVAPARAVTVTSMTMFGDSAVDNLVREHVFTPANAAITLGGDAHRLEATSVSASNDYDVELIGPPGQALHPGVYTATHSTSLVGPTLRADAEGHGCSWYTGSFEIKDLDIAPTGAVQRLWALYEAHCEGGSGSTFGEIRYAAPQPGDGIGTAPRGLRWPGADVGAAGPDLPLTVSATYRSVTLARASVTGPAATDFPLRADGCSDHAVAAGANCQMAIGFAPTASGPRTATLHLVDTSGASRDVPLEGIGHAGTTSATITSDADHPAGRGFAGSFTPTTARFSLDGNSWGIFAELAPSGGSPFEIDLSPPSGQVIAPGGHYTFASGAIITVRRDNRWCDSPRDGHFDVDTVTYDADGHPTSFGVSFEDDCRNPSAVLRGTFDYRIGDAPAAPAWTLAGPRPAAWSTPACTPAPRHPLRGTRRGDRLFARTQSTLVRAGAGNDHATTLAGDDCLFGGKGRDVLHAGDGEDYIDGGPGRDIIDCGPGFDVVRITPGDRVRNCERVVR
jgi:hypothetical protein